MCFLLSVHVFAYPCPVYDRSGTFAEVKKGIDRRSGDAWAMKMIAKAKLDKEDEDALAVEVEILEKVKHPNIVQLR